MNGHTLSEAEEVADMLRGQARAYTQQARELYALALRIEEPDEGVTVTFDRRGMPAALTVRFVGPPIDLRKTA